MASTSDAQRKSKGTGRKKIDIKKIENKNSLKVAFSKRRQGLFRKAEEICRLCDAMIAIVVFSPKGRLYEFGYPSSESVIDRFLGDQLPSNSVTAQLHGDPSHPESSTRLSVDENNVESSISGETVTVDDEEEEEEESALTGLSSEKITLAEKNTAEEVKSTVEGVDKKFWWEESIDELSEEELGVYIDSLTELMKNVAAHAEELAMRNTCELKLFK